MDDNEFVEENEFENDKFGDDIEEVSVRKKKKKNKNKSLVLIISIAVVLVLFFIVLLLLLKSNKPKKKETVSNEIELNLTNDTVGILYDLITYGTNAERNEKFLKESNVTESSFTAQEKLEIALQYVTSNDITRSDKKTAAGANMYFISRDILEENMQKYFGDSVFFEDVDSLEYPFQFEVNSYNNAKLTYNAEDEGYDIEFIGYKGPEIDGTISKYSYKLVKATQSKLDNSVKLIEKIIFLDTKDNSSGYDINIYKDYNHTNLIDSKTNLTDDDILTNQVSVSDYIDKAGTITYTFKLNSDDTYYFDNSKIE